jgi:hypothetical protein
MAEERTRAQADMGTASATAASAAQPAGPAAAATPAAPVRRPVLSSWPDFQAMLAVAFVPFVGWLVMAITIGLTFGHAYSENLGREFQNQALGKFDAALWASAAAMFSSLTAGLGFVLYGSAPQQGATSVALVFAPLGSLVALAAVMALTTRFVFRRRPPFSIWDMFVRITVASASCAILIYAVSALAILLFADKGQPPAIPPTGNLPVGVAGSVSGTGAGPVPWSLVTILFPTLWVGAAIGVFSLAPARALMAFLVAGKSWAGVVSVWNWLSPTFLAIRTYVVAVLLSSVVLVAGAIVWLLTVSIGPKPDAGAVLLTIPTLLATGPNALVVMAMAATGSMMDFGNDGSTVMRETIWRSDGWVILGSLLCLVVPPFATGISVRRRRPSASPAQVLVAGAGVTAVFLMVAVISWPSIVTTSAPAAASAVGLVPVTAGTSMHLVSDLTQAIVVGGLAIVSFLMFGFVVGGVSISQTPQAAVAAGWAQAAAPGPRPTPRGRAAAPPASAPPAPHAGAEPDTSGKPK